MNSESTIKERMQRHWLISILIVCAVVAGATWKLLNVLVVQPRDFEIDRLRRQLGELSPDIKIGFAVRATPKDFGDEITILEAKLKPGESAITVDGECLVSISEVLATKKVHVQITMLNSGTKLNVRNWKTDDEIQTYRGPAAEPTEFDYRFVLLEVTGDQATVLVTRLTKPEPAIRRPK